MLEAIGRSWIPGKLKEVAPADALCRHSEYSRAHELAIGESLAAPFARNCGGQWGEKSGSRRCLYATSDMKLPPGVVALLYRLRWDLEKTFDEFENKLQENKAWACGDEAKRAQALFILSPALGIAGGVFADPGVGSPAPWKGVL